MAGDAPIVGKVSLKVVPNTKGFRRKVEQQMAALGDGDVDINPNMDGFRQKVQAATKGLRASIDTDLDSNGLRSRAKAAAAAASGETVEFDTELDIDTPREQARKLTKLVNREFRKVRFDPGKVTGISIKPLDPKTHLPGLKQELKFVNEYLKQLSFKPFKASAQQTARVIQGMRGTLAKIDQSPNKAIKGFRDLTRAAKVERGITKWTSEIYSLSRREIPKGFVNSIKAVGTAARHMPSDLKVAGQAGVKPLVDQFDKLSKRIDHSRNTLRGMYKVASTDIEKHRGNLDPNLDWISEEIQGLRKLSAARKAFNRNKVGKGYDPKLHQEFKKLEDAAKRLRGVNPQEAIGDFRDIAPRIEKMQKALGATGAEMGRVKSQTEAIEKSFGAIQKHSDLRDKFIRHPELEKVVNGFGRVEKGIKRARLAAFQFGNASSKAFDDFNGQIDRSLPGRGIDRMGDGFAAAGSKLRKFGSDIEKVGFTGVHRKIKGIGSSIRDFSKNLVQVNPRIGQTAADMRNLGTSTSVASQGIKRLNKETKKAKSGPGILKKLSNAWGKFHQPENRIFGLTQMGWIAAAVVSLAAPLTGLIGGLVSSLPALGSAFAAALGVGYLGWDGVKDAAEAAVPAIDQAKEALSDVSRERLTPQFAAVGEVIEQMIPNMERVGHGMADFTQGLVDATTSDQGLSNIGKTLDNTAELFSDLQPFATDFTAGLLEMAGAGSETFGKLSEGLNNFGSSFRENIEEMSDQGTLQDAIESTYDVIGSFGTNIGKIVRAGMEELPDMAEPFTDLLDTLGNSLTQAMPGLSKLSQGVFSGLDSGVQWLTGFAERMAPSISGILEAIGPGAQELITGIGDLANGVGPAIGSVVEAFSPLVSEIASDVGDGLSKIGAAFSDNQGEIEEGARGIAETLEGFYKSMEIDDADMSRFEDDMGNMVEGIRGFFTDLDGVVEEATGSKHLGDFIEGIATMGGSNMEEASQQVLDGLDQSEQDIIAGLQDYGSGFERFTTHWTKFNDLGHVASQELGKLGHVFTDGAEGLRAAAERAMDNTKIDLTPQIEAIDTAQTRGQLLLLQDEMEAIIRDGTPSDLEMVMEIIPNVQLSQDLGMGTFANLQQDLLDGVNSMTDMQLEAAVDVRITPAVQISEELGMEGFGTLQQDLINRVRSMPPTEVEAAVNVNPDVTITETTISESMGEVFSRIASEVEAQSAGQMQQSAAAAGANLSNAFNESVSGMGEAVEVEFQLASQSVEMSGQSISQGIGAAMATAKDTVTTEAAGLGTGISTGMATASATAAVAAAGMVNTIATSLQALPARVSAVFSSLGSIMISGTMSAASGVTSAFVAMVGAVAGVVNAMTAGVTSSFAAMGSAMISTISAAVAGMVAALTGGVAQAVAVVGSLPGQAQAALGNVGGVLVASGAALIQGFVQGMRSQQGAVAAAAASIAAEARAHFPFSPAKKGPLSGKGYTLYSGMALVEDFAKGMQKQIPAVEAAAASVAGAAQKKFNDFSVNPVASMEGFKRDEILQPVLESNAKRIADHREREADAAERLSERIKDIEESDSKAENKAKRIADARESAAERSAESYKDLMESIEAPEYGDINRSIQSYWIDGMRDVLTSGLTDIMKEVDLAGQTRRIALAAVSEARGVFGNHPMFDQVEANVQAEHFSRILQKVIEDSGIAEIPIDFAVSNIDQLKSDLGMGDGVISRAIDLGLETDPAATDARWARQNPVEIHYHVEDMEEAIRLEQQRERKEMMKHK